MNRPKRKKPPIVHLESMSMAQQVQAVGSTASAGKKVGFVLPADAQRRAVFLELMRKQFPECAIESVGEFANGTHAFVATRRQN